MDFNVRKIYGLTVIYLGERDNKPFYRAAIPSDPFNTTMKDWDINGEGSTPDDAINDLNNKLTVINKTII